MLSRDETIVIEAAKLLVATPKLLESLYDEFKDDAMHAIAGSNPEQVDFREQQYFLLMALDMLVGKIHNIADKDQDNG